MPAGPARDAGPAVTSAREGLGVPEGYRARDGLRRRRSRARWLSVVFALNVASRGLVGAGPEAGQQADLAGEGGPVVVDGVVLDEPVGDPHHVYAPDVDPAPGRGDALERAAGERVGRMPLDHRRGVVGHDPVDGHREIGEGGEQLAEEGPDRLVPADLANCDKVVDVSGYPVATMPSGSFLLTASKAARATPAGVRVAAELIATFVESGVGSEGAVMQVVEMRTIMAR
jgi:hypothetical protein